MPPPDRRGPLALRPHSPIDRHLLQKLLGEVLQRVDCGFGANLLQHADEAVAVCGRKGVPPVDLEVPIAFDFPFVEYFDRFEYFELYRLFRFAL